MTEDVDREAPVFPQVVPRQCTLFDGDQNERWIERKRGNRIRGQAVLARRTPGCDNGDARGELTHDLPLLPGIERHGADPPEQDGERFDARLAVRQEATP
jgi:hypothetical protein